jgi:hypothetical protein
MILVVWAASFNLDERGAEISPDNLDSSATTVPSMSTAPSTSSISDTVKSRRHSERSATHASDQFDSQALRDRTSQMVLEILSHIEALGILRRPTWDGVRVLLLVLGITEGHSPSHENATFDR